MGADPRIGALRVQSTSKDPTYRGRTLMLHEGLAFVRREGKQSKTDQYRETQKNPNTVAENIETKRHP
jgi:hypothetical protein